MLPVTFTTYVWSYSFKVLLTTFMSVIIRQRHDGRVHAFWKRDTAVFSTLPNCRYRHDCHPPCPRGVLVVCIGKSPLAVAASHAQKALMSGCSHCDVNQMPLIKHMGYWSMVVLTSLIVQLQPISNVLYQYRSDTSFVVCWECILSAVVCSLQHHGRGRQLQVLDSLVSGFTGVVLMPNMVHLSRWCLQ